MCCKLELRGFEACLRRRDTFLHISPANHSSIKVGRLHMWRHTSHLNHLSVSSPSLCSLCDTEVHVIPYRLSHGVTDRTEPSICHLSLCDHDPAFHVIPSPCQPSHCLTDLTEPSAASGVPSVSRRCATSGLQCATIVPLSAVAAPDARHSGALL